MWPSTLPKAHADHDADEEGDRKKLKLEPAPGLEPEPREREYNNSDRTGMEDTYSVTKDGVIKIGRSLTLAPRKAKNKISLPVSFMQTSVSSGERRPAASRFLEPESRTPKSPPVEERTPDENSVRDVMTASPRDTPIELNSPKEQWWADGAKAMPTSYYDPWFSVATPSSQNRETCDKTALANIA